MYRILPPEKPGPEGRMVFNQLGTWLPAFSVRITSYIPETAGCDPCFDWNLGLLVGIVGRSEIEDKLTGSQAVRRYSTEFNPSVSYKINGMMSAPLPGKTRTYKSNKIGKLPPSLQIFFIMIFSHLKFETTKKQTKDTHRIHVWYIYLHLQ